MLFRLPFSSVRTLLVAAVMLGWCCPVCSAPGAVRTFHVRDFAAVPDGKTECGAAIRDAIRAAIAAGPGSEVVLDAGIYRVRANNPRGYCFPIHQAANLVVRGAGKATKIVITDPAAGGFLFGLCRQVSVRDLTVDYDPLPFCQGTIRAMDAKAGSFDLEVETGYPTPDAENFVKAMEPYGKWGMIIDPTTRRIRAGTPDHYMTPRWERREGRTWRFFTTQEHYRLGLRHMRVGDSYVHLARGYGSAVLAQGCEGIEIRNVVIRASPGLAVGLVGNRGEIAVRGLEVRFAPNNTRLLTTNADGVHCQQNRAGPIIERCYFEGMADDAINIYAPPNVLLEVRGPNEWLVSPQCLVLPGDRLQVFDPKTGSIRGEAKAAKVAVEGRRLLLTLDSPLEGAVAGSDHRDADTLYNLDACGAGFRIRHNHMNGNRRYGCLLRAGGGVVEDNVFEDTTGAGVVLTNEPDWPEGPVPWGITIRGNRFLRGGTCQGYADSPHGAALAVRAARLGFGLAEGNGIRDVVIEKNEFVDRAGAAIYVGGAGHVTVRDNRLTASAGAELRRKGGAILVERSAAVNLANIEVIDPRPGITAAVEILPGTAPGESGVRIENLKTDLAPGARPAMDRRDSRPFGKDRK
jgi:hypothetical protein